MVERETIERIMAAADIVDVVKEFVTLRRSGANYKGLCPFHEERTPSFVVSPSKQLCKCFSCGKGGNVVHFIMEHEQLTYPEALRWLGRRYGIEVAEREQTDEERRAESLRESMLALNEWAGRYFVQTLTTTADGLAVGLAYLRQRSLRDDIIRKFQLGYALPSREALAREALSRGYSRELLLKTGLAYETERHELRDRYHGRVIFPIHSVSGRTVAFGGRILDEKSNPNVGKYVNSPESEVYHKGRELYGLYQAKHAIVRQDRCYLVEGYMDVLSMHQSGVENVVASSGTSLTEGQIRLLHRFTDNVTVLYDGDAAGIKASLRGIDMLLTEGLNVRALLLPDGHDPDSFARANDASAFRTYIADHEEDFIRFKTRLLMSDAGADPASRARLVSSVVGSISAIPGPIVRQMYIRECAATMDVDEKLIVAEVARMRREQKQAGEKKQSATETTAEAPAAAPSSAPSSAESEDTAARMLVALIIKYGELPLPIDEGNGPAPSVASYVKNELDTDSLQLPTPLYRRILDEAVSHAADADFHTQAYFTTHPDSQISLLAAQLCEEKYRLSVMYTKTQQLAPENQRLSELVPRLVSDYKYAVVKGRMKQLLSALSDPDISKDASRSLALMNEYKKMSEVERIYARLLGDRVITPG